MTTRLLDISDLTIAFGAARPAVDSASLDVDRGEIVALVGESGSGKSMTARAILGLLPDGATPRGSIVLDGAEMIGVPDADFVRVRGNTVSLIFQEPQSALNPVRRVGWQLREAIRAHRKTSRADAATCPMPKYDAGV